MRSMSALVISIHHVHRTVMGRNTGRAPLQTSKSLDRTCLVPPLTCFFLFNSISRVLTVWESDESEGMGSFNETKVFCFTIQRAEQSRAKRKNHRVILISRHGFFLVESIDKPSLISFFFSVRNIYKIIQGERKWKGIKHEKE